jgi:hypothetical protein
MASIPKPALAEPVVQLYRNVVERLNRDVRNAFEANPPQGSEVGGLLLGTADLRAGRIDVQDFEPRSCEARSDGRFIVSGSEREKLKHLPRQHGGQLQVVGCYRSHIDTALTLRDDDFALAQACMRDSGGLFLLVQPSADGSLKAGFFFWQDCHIDSSFSFHECSFDTQLPSFQPPLPVETGVSTRGVRPGASVTAPRYQLRVEGRQEPANIFSRLDRVFRARANAVLWRAAVLGRCAALLSRCAALLSWVRAIHWRTRAQKLWTAVVARPVYPVLGLSIVAVYMVVYLVWPGFKNFGRTAGSAELELQVDRREGNLRVNWNQNAPLVQRARGAALTIRDGDSPPVELQLEPEQLRNGSIVYTPKSASVQFSLAITAPDGAKTAESVLALASRRSPGSTRITAALKQPLAGRGARDRITLPPLESGRDFTRQKSVRVVPSDADVRSTSAPTPTQAERVDPPLTNPPAARTAEAASSAVYIAPRTLHELRPVLSTAIRATMTSEVELQVKVKIDDAGRVTQADTLTATGPATRRLVDVTEKAARLWKFAPAMRGSESVPCEAVVVFRFRPSPE